MKELVKDAVFFFILGVVLATFLTVMEETIRESVRYELRQQLREAELNHARRDPSPATA